MSIKLSKASNAEKAKLCKQYFYIGLAFLPFVWLTNVFWFYKYAIGNKEFEEKKIIKFYVKASLIGSLVWLIVGALWITVFQLFRTQGVAWADYMTFIFPLGRV